MQNTLSCDVTSYILLCIYQCFEAMCFFHLQDIIRITDTFTMLLQNIGKFLTGNNNTRKDTQSTIYGNVNSYLYVNIEARVQKRR